ncbi:MAG: VTT domain-containing protein [Pseudomonadota bacterium]
MVELFHQLFGYLKDPQSLIAAVGLVGLIFIVFAETGLLFGFFLPGDSLLISAGIIASTGTIDVWQTGILLSFAAVIGDAVGFWIGKATGPKLFKREDSLLFRKAHLLAAQKFYEKHGGKTIVFARFIPIIRTFAPTVAGIAGMPYKHFLAYNIFGGVLWIWSMLLGGYYLAKQVPNIEENIHFLIVGVVFVSILPMIVGWFKSRVSNSKPV